MARDMDIGDRRAKMSELLAIKGFMPLSELAEAAGVSESTARRDLETLESQGLVRRTHGGAVYVKDLPAHKMAFADRETTAVAEKQAIAAAVAERIPPGGTLILDGGTTCSHVAAALAGRELSVITNSVPIAMRLSGEVATEVTVVGGYLYPRTGVALGEMAEGQLAALHAGMLVLSCAGAGVEGVYTANQMMVATERRMMQSADRVVLAIDHTKLGRRAVVKLCDWNEVDLVVTDADADDEARQWLDSLPVQVVYAKSNP